MSFTLSDEMLLNDTPFQSNVEHKTGGRLGMFPGTIMATSGAERADSLTPSAITAKVTATVTVFLSRSCASPDFLEGIQSSLQQMGVQAQATKTGNTINLMHIYCFSFLVVLWFHRACSLVSIGESCIMDL